MRKSLSTSGDRVNLLVSPLVLSLLAIGFNQIPVSAHSRPLLNEVKLLAQATATRTEPVNPGLLTLGSEGEEVSEIQTALKRLGFYQGAITGIYGDTTARAVRTFQQKNGLGVDGIIGHETRRRLIALLVKTPATASTRPNPPVITASAQSTTTRTTSSSPPANQTSANSPTPTSSPSPSASDSSKDDRETTAAINVPKPDTTTPRTSAINVPKPNTTPTRVAAARPNNASAAAIDLPILRLGLQGPAVTKLQQRLRTLGLYKGTVDGVFGADTETSVRAAQERFKLTSDGVVGPATWRALLR